MNTTKIIDIKLIKENPNNPRIIKDDKFKKLVKSVKDFPEMLEIRPIVVNSDMIVLGGNMRLKACKEAGYSEIPVIIAKDLDVAKQNEFALKDNVSFGEWDWDILANEWENESLINWGLDIPKIDGINYNPLLIPETSYSEVTQEQIKKEAERLAIQMLKTHKKIECICPECGSEFLIDG